MEDGTFGGAWSPGLQNARMERSLSEIKLCCLGCLGKWRTWLSLGTKFFGLESPCRIGAEDHGTWTKGVFLGFGCSTCYF